MYYCTSGLSANMYLERGASIAKHRLVREASAGSLLNRRCSWIGQIQAILNSCGMSGELNGGYGRSREVGKASKQVHSILVNQEIKKGSAGPERLTLLVFVLG